MEDIELLLSDEFATFTATINEIREKKKVEQESFKELYEAYKAKMEAFEKQARTAQKEWEAWKVSQGGAKAQTAEKPKSVEPPTEKSVPKKK
jgi:DNA-binding transcriptional regulator YiaG